MTESIVNSSQQIAAKREFMTNVYIWMSLGLFLTSAVAYIFSTSAGLSSLILGCKPLFYGLFIAEFALVVYFSARIRNMSANAALTVFLLYSALNGMTLSIIFLIYTAASIVSTFFVTAGTFGIMSAYGYFTKRDLTSIGNFCFMGLIGVILASVVNIFMHNSAMYWIITYISIFVFIGLTAYDTQKIKALNNNIDKDSDEVVKTSIYGALILYLDFLNLFLNILRILGRRK